MAAICNDGRERCVTGFVVVIYQIRVATSRPTIRRPTR